MSYLTTTIDRTNNDRLYVLTFPFWIYPPPLLTPYDNIAISNPRIYEETEKNLSTNMSW